MLFLTIVLDSGDLSSTVSFFFLIFFFGGGGCGVCVCFALFPETGFCCVAHNPPVSLS